MLAAADVVGGDFCRFAAAAADARARKIMETDVGPDVRPRAITAENMGVAVESPNNGEMVGSHCLRQAAEPELIFNYMTSSLADS